MDLFATRREFLAAMVAAGAAAAWPTTTVERRSAPRIKSVFQVSVFTDELTQDFERACAIAADEFGLELSLIHI